MTSTRAMRASASVWGAREEGSVSVPTSRNYQILFRRSNPVISAVNAQRFCHPLTAQGICPLLAWSGVERSDDRSGSGFTERSVNIKDKGGLWAVWATPAPLAGVVQAVVGKPALRLVHSRGTVHSPLGLDPIRSDSVRSDPRSRSGRGLVFPGREERGARGEAGAREAKARALPRLDETHAKPLGACGAWLLEALRRRWRRRWR